MKGGFLIAAVAAISLSAVATASAGVQFGAPDFPNYLSYPGAPSCDWTTSAYIHACPTPASIDVAPTPAAVPTHKRKKS
jgi:hypothetical protein